jgi:hypothetical protein
MSSCSITFFTISSVLIAQHTRSSLTFFIVSKSFAQALFAVGKELNLRDIYSIWVISILLKARKAVNSILAMMGMMAAVMSILICINLV